MRKEETAMKMSKINWAFVGSIACMLGGLIFDEIQREKDTQETKQELINYVDKKMAGKDPDLEDEEE